MTTDQIAIKSRKCALKALKDQRAALASEIEQIKRELSQTTAHPCGRHDPVARPNRGY
jgi:hypothetical protein